MAGKYFSVEMMGVEPTSELGCDCASTVCSLSFDLNSTSVRKTKSCTLDLQECWSTTGEMYYFLAWYLLHRILSIRHQEKRCSLAVAGYARAGTRSNFEKYGLFTLFLARKFECILTNPHSLSTRHTYALTNRRCLASPKKIEVISIFLGDHVLFIRRMCLIFLSL